MVVRPYTPIKPVLPEEEDGTFQLVVKTYFPNESPFPPGGTVSNWLDVLEIGEEMDVKGPNGGIHYMVDQRVYFVNFRELADLRSRASHFNSNK